MCRALRKLSNESFLLQSIFSNYSSSLTFYQDDILDEHKSFENQFNFLRDHFFFRMKWAHFKLSFKKLYLFQSSIKVLKIRHHVEERVQILKSRVEKIMKFSISQNKTNVRAFLKIIELVHKWVSNFSEISRSLTRFIEKVDWKWTMSKKLTFEILKIKCTIVTCMHEYDYFLSAHFYTNASLYEEDLVITQFRIQDEKITEIFILYHFITFKAAKRKYLIFKKELCALVRFVLKYDYFCKHSRNIVIIHTNHKSLIWFLRSNAQKDIYDHWANKLRRLNLEIKYISERRNQITNELFRIIFRNENCTSNESVRQIMNSICKNSKWIWKNEKKEYRDFLKSLKSTEKQKVLNQKTLQKENVFAQALFIDIKDEVFIEITSWDNAYKTSSWFETTYRILGDSDSRYVISLNSEEFFRAMNYRVKNDILWKYHKFLYLSCIWKSKVLRMLRVTHDDNDYWKTNHFNKNSRTSILILAINWRKEIYSWMSSMCFTWLDLEIAVITSRSSSEIVSVNKIWFYWISVNH